MFSYDRMCSVTVDRILSSVSSCFRRYAKRDLRICQKRPTYMAKETCVYGKRDLRIWKKRSTSMAKEIFFYGKRMSKETYISRSLLPYK